MNAAAPVDSYDTFDAIEGVSPPAARPALVGHGAIFAEMIAAARSERLHHAWLLQGPRGIGKATAAFAFARILSGAEYSHEETGDRTTARFRTDDPVFRQIAIGSLPTLIHVTRPPVERGSGYRTQITVEEVRRLGRFFHATASGKGWRIALIDPADDLNRSAANALLKLLEEPPARSLFLIVNHTPGRLLPTIRSRCRLARFEPLSDDELTLALAHCGAAPSEGAEADILLRSAEGSVRKALMLATHGGAEIEQTLATLLASDVPDLNALQSMIDSLTLKGREASYDLLLSALMSAIAAMSEDRLKAGDMAAAAAFAELWQAESSRLSEAAAFNLDRKQMALTTASRIFALRATFHGSSDGSNGAAFRD